MPTASFNVIDHVKFNDVDLESGVTNDDITASDMQLINDALASKKYQQWPERLKLNYENGTVIHDSFEHYLSAKAHYSTGSIVKLALGNALSFQWDTTEGVKEELEKFKDQSHFDLGRFLHLAVLEPDKWKSVVVEPKASRASHEGLDKLIEFWQLQLNDDTDTSGMKTDQKKFYIDGLKEKSGLSVLDEKQYLIIKTLHDRWKKYANGIWYEAISNAHKETSIYCNDYNGLPIRIRPDGMLFENQIGVNAIVSVKTTSAPTLRQFRNDCGRYGYYMKEAAYQDVASHVLEMEFRNTITVVFQTVEPFNVGVFIWSQEDLAVWRSMFNDAFAEAKDCIETGEFPGWDELATENGIILLDMPEWVGAVE